MHPHSHVWSTVQPVRRAPPTATRRRPRRCTRRPSRTRTTHTTRNTKRRNRDNSSLPLLTCRSRCPNRSAFTLSSVMRRALFACGGGGAASEGEAAHTKREDGGRATENEATGGGCASPLLPASLSFLAYVLCVCVCGVGPLGAARDGAWKAARLTSPRRRAGRRRPGNTHWRRDEDCT